MLFSPPKPKSFTSEKSAASFLNERRAGTITQINHNGARVLRVALTQAEFVPTGSQKGPVELIEALKTFGFKKLLTDIENDGRRDMLFTTDNGKGFERLKSAGVNYVGSQLSAKPALED